MLTHHDKLARMEATTLYDLLKRAGSRRDPRLGVWITANRAKLLPTIEAALLALAEDTTEDEAVVGEDAFDLLAAAVADPFVEQPVPPIRVIDGARDRDVNQHTWHVLWPDGTMPGRYVVDVLNLSGYSTQAMAEKAKAGVRSDNSAWIVLHGKDVARGVALARQMEAAVPVAAKRDGVFGSGIEKIARVAAENAIAAATENGAADPHREAINRLDDTTQIFDLCGVGHPTCTVPEVAAATHGQLRRIADRAIAIVSSKVPAPIAPRTPPDAARSTRIQITGTNLQSEIDIQREIRDQTGDLQLDDDPWAVVLPHTWGNYLYIPWDAEQATALRLALVELHQEYDQEAEKNRKLSAEERRNYKAASQSLWTIAKVVLRSVEDRKTAAPRTAVAPTPAARPAPKVHKLEPGDWTAYHRLGEYEPVRVLSITEGNTYSFSGGMKKTQDVTVERWDPVRGGSGEMKTEVVHASTHPDDLAKTYVGNQIGLSWWGVAFGDTTPEDAIRAFKKQKRDEHLRAVEYAQNEEAKRKQADKTAGPYYADIEQEIVTTGLTDVSHTKLLKKWLAGHGIDASLTVRRYSMASGINLKPGSKRRDWSDAERATLQALLPGTRIYHDMGLYPSKREDRSDGMSDYHDPGGFRVALDAVESLELAIVDEANRVYVPLRVGGIVVASNAAQKRAVQAYGNRSAAQKTRGAVWSGAYGAMDVVVKAAPGGSEWTSVRVQDDEYAYGKQQRRWARGRALPQQILDEIPESIRRDHLPQAQGGAAPVQPVEFVGQWRLAEVTGGAPWWNVVAYDPRGQRMRYGYNEVERRWARREKPPTDVIDAAKHRGLPA